MYALQATSVHWVSVSTSIRIQPTVEQWAMCALQATFVLWVSVLISIRIQPTVEQ